MTISNKNDDAIVISNKQLGVDDSGSDTGYAYRYQLPPTFTFLDGKIAFGQYKLT